MQDEELIYEKLPVDVAERHVLLLDPVLATGTSAARAVQVGARQLGKTEKGINKEYSSSRMFLQQGKPFLPFLAKLWPSPDIAVVLRWHLCCLRCAGRIQSSHDDMA